MENSDKKNWSENDPKAQTEAFIDHVYNQYYKSYNQESDHYEKVNNRFFFTITAIGFLVTILLGLQGMLGGSLGRFGNAFTVAAFVLPSVSSMLMIYVEKKGFRRKEELREEARIISKHLVNEAKIRFALAKEDADYQAIYLWLNQEIKQLQLHQAKNYFVVNNRTEPDKTR